MRAKAALGLGEAPLRQPCSSPAAAPERLSTRLFAVPVPPARRLHAAGNCPLLRRRCLNLAFLAVKNNVRCTFRYSQSSQCEKRGHFALKRAAWPSVTLHFKKIKILIPIDSIPIFPRARQWLLRPYHCVRLTHQYF